MSIAEKLNTIAENVPKVFQAGYDKGKSEGGSVQNPLEYATSLGSTYLSAEFPENYEMTINVPAITSLSGCFHNATGITKLTIKGNVAGNIIAMANAFRIPTLEILDLSEFNAIVSSDGKNIFNGAKALREIKGIFDFTNATALANVFKTCFALKEVRFKENSINVSIGIENSSELSTESIQSIIDGLATVETAQTLTLNSKISLTDEQKNTIKNKGWTLSIL